MIFRVLASPSRPGVENRRFFVRGWRVISWENKIRIRLISCPLHFFDFFCPWKEVGFSLPDFDFLERGGIPLKLQFRFSPSASHWNFIFIFFLLRCSLKLKFYFFPSEFPSKLQFQWGSIGEGGGSCCVLQSRKNKKLKNFAAKKQALAVPSAVAIKFQQKKKTLKNEEVAKK